MSFPDSSDWSEDTSEESVKRDKVPKLPRGRSYQITLPSPVLLRVLERMSERADYAAWKAQRAVKHRTNYRALFESGAMQPIIESLSQETIPDGFLQQLHEETTIPIDTLKGWRRDLRSDPPHVPYSQPANISKRGLTPEQEEKLSERIQSDYILEGNFLPLTLVQTLALRIHRESQASPRDADPRDLNEIVKENIQRNSEEFLPPGEKGTRPFKASRRWRIKFMKRHHLSKRKPHAKRRPSVNPDDIERFRARIRTVLTQYPLDHVINMDETSWKLLNSGFVTVGNTGSETVECQFQGDPKMCLTAIAAIDAAGGKLPMWILARGTTTRCERRYRNDDILRAAVNEGRLIVSHQVNGWTDAAVAGEYLRWLRGRYGSDELVLIWDVFISHRCDEVKTLAEELGIRLEFIPPGATGNCQPLDRRIFGNLKSRARARFDAFWAIDHDPSMEDSIAMMLESWASIDQFEVLDAFETALN